MNAEQDVMDFPAEQRQGHDFEDAGAGNAEGGGHYELDENGQRIPHGMGQSKSSRRRRRKRKMKSGEPGSGSAAEGGSENGESASGDDAPIVSMQAAAAPAQPPAQSSGGRSGGRSQSGSSQQNAGSQSGSQGLGNAQPGSNAPGGTKRWKKKFRERDRQRPGGGAEPGNQATGAQPSSNGFSSGGGYSSNGGGQQFRGADTHQPGNGGGGFKRKGGSFSGGSNGGGGKQRGARGFVGPMDHSYRATNGNFDTTPSTMDAFGGGGFSGGGGRRGGYQGDSQPIDYSQGRSVPIAADAPTHIYFFIEDLFITAKINETARKLGVKVAFVKNEKESIAALTAGEDNDRPSLIVFDLNNANAKPMTLMPKLKAKLKKSVSIIGFLSHLQGDLKAKAMESGCDTVMPRAAFSQNLPNLLRRYGIEDVEETANYNQ